MMAAAPAKTLETAHVMAVALLGTVATVAIVTIVLPKPHVPQPIEPLALTQQLTPWRSSWQPRRHDDAAHKPHTSDIEDDLCVLRPE